MNFLRTKIAVFGLSAVLVSCGGDAKQGSGATATDSVAVAAAVFENIEPEVFADIKVLRYEVPGFEKLTAKQKELVYYLYEAAISGRDISYDQNNQYNLRIRKLIEQAAKSYDGDKSSQDWKEFMVYAKRFWFANGIHHHYSEMKFVPGFSEKFFEDLVLSIPADKLPLDAGMDAKALIAMLKPVIFDPKVASKRVSKDGGDLILSSASNFYKGLTQKEVEDFYASKKDAADKQPVSLGLNSQLVKAADGVITERPWMVGGMYGGAIKQIVFWLKKASEVAENDAQKTAFLKLIEFYETGSLKKFDEYCIAWVKDTASTVDFINGFIEVYGDPLGYRGSYESIVQVTDPAASERIRAISVEAQWFEDNSPIAKEHKKDKVTGISARVINVVAEGGDAAPATPIGINLPNSDWIRKEHGSKSVSLDNIKNAYSLAGSSGLLKEFCYDEAEINRAKEHSDLAGKLHTDMHEVIGHASGQINPGVSGEALKNYSSTLEEARADLVALYYLMDQKLIDLGVMPSMDLGKAAYDNYILNGLFLQLNRLKLGDNIEEDHMRNRQLVAQWVYEKGKADKTVEIVKRDGKTYFKINDYLKLKELFGQLLKELQRIKSEGDFEAGKNLVTQYGVKVNQAHHKEVLERFAALKTTPYSGFIQPKLTPVLKDGKVVDVTLEYPKDFVEQMLYYGEKYSFLPVVN